MFDTDKELEAYFEGVISGIETYAWWQDGVQYVGTTGKTLREAIEEVRQRHLQAQLALAIEGTK